jgi:hypothetical protein
MIDLDLVSFYKSYGESLATRLKAIGHTKANQAFIYIEDIASAEEIVSAQSNGLKPDRHVLVWERFTEQLSDGGRDNYNSRPQGSLAVIKKPAKDGRGLSSATIDECRNVALKVIALMRRDEQTYGSLLDQAGIRFDLNGQAGEPIPLLKGGWVGYGFVFEWLAPLNLDLSDDDLIEVVPE